MNLPTDSPPMRVGCYTTYGAQQHADHYHNFRVSRADKYELQCIICYQYGRIVEGIEILEQLQKKSFWKRVFKK